MGGSSKSKSSSTNTTYNTNSTVAVDGDNNGLVLSNVDGSTITVTDQGAIDAAMKLASESLEMSQANYQDTINLIEHNTGQVAEVSKGAMETVLDMAGEVLEFSSNVQAGALTAIDDNLEQSLAFVNTANSPDGGMTVEVIKPLVYGSAAVAIAYLVARGIK